MTVDTVLIETIVREVVGQLRANPPEPPVLVLAPEKDVDLPVLEKYLTKTCRVTYLDTVGVDTVIGSDRAYDKVIVPLLSCTDMADLALGRSSGQIAGVILNLLLKGQAVSVIEFEYSRYAGSAPGQLWALYQSYENTLAGFGLARCALPAAQSIVLRKKLVTEKDLAELVSSGAKKLTLGANAVITALAADVARAHQIEITRN